MPLPDERPRQSVANLIGRFEQQNKRQSPSVAPSIPRSTSVSSQIAGDPAKEETKEKREWPPKIAASPSTDQIALTPSSSSLTIQTNSPSMSSQLIPKEPSEPTAAANPASSEPLKPPAMQKQANTGSGSRINPPSPTKPRPSSAYAKSSAKSPSKSSLASSVSQPLKPQHTGQSVNSNASTIRSPPKSTPRSAPKSTPVTPSRPKTPAAHATSTPRPKTPSSGLFAPTAASLARSRNAPPPVPPPVKKATLSSNAAERLSKPTAASMSKARTPAQAATPIRAVKSSAASVPRGQSKLRLGLAPARMKEGKEKQLVHATDDTTHEPDELETGLVGNGHGGHDSDEVVLSGRTADFHDEVHDHGDDVPVTDPVAESLVENSLESIVVNAVENVAGISPIPDARIEVPVNAEVVEDVFHIAEPEVHAAVLAEEALANGNVEPNGSPESQEVAPVAEETACDAESEPSAVGGDIEDMVIMLEGVSLSKSRPLSIVTIPDEHGEIPDEDQS